MWPVLAARRWQSWRKKTAFAIIEPRVSNASVIKVWVVFSDWNFNSFRSAVPSAAAPADDGVASRYDSAKPIGDCDVWARSYTCQPAMDSESVHPGAFHLNERDQLVPWMLARWRGHLLSLKYYYYYSLIFNAISILYSQTVSTGVCNRRWITGNTWLLLFVMFRAHIAVVERVRRVENPPFRPIFSTYDTSFDEKYCTLMELCWSELTSKRPPFKVIVKQLRNISHRVLVFTHCFIFSIRIQA